MNNLVCLGINHHKAPLALRERFSLNNEQIIQELHCVIEDKHCSESVIVSTCNRFEIYAIASSVDLLKDWFAKLIHSEAIELDHFLYVYQDQSAIQHLLRVACGVDSMVLGEPQILGQLKQAFALASAEETIGSQLGHLFPFVFHMAKKIRNQTGIGNNPVSVAYTAVTLAKQIFSDLSRTEVLLIGAGETIELAAEHLYDQPVGKMIVANRTVLRAKELTEKINAQAIRIGDIPEYLADVDIIITSTASQLPILGKGLLERAIKQRKRKPLLIIDMAVPRDVEAEVGELPDIYLYNIDALQAIVDANIDERRLAAQEAEVMIVSETNHFQYSRNSLESIPTICAYRQKMEELRDEELRKAQKALLQGDTPEKVLDQLARDLTKKLMHAPSVQMRMVSYEGRSDLLEWAKRLLGITEK